LHRHLTEFSKKIRHGEEGVYIISFASCLQQSGGVSFDLKLEMFNLDAHGQRDYLSVGYSPLPVVFGLFSASYVLALLVWIFLFLRRSQYVIFLINLLSSEFFLLICMYFSQQESKQSSLRDEWPGCITIVGVVL
jgi:hypothetical protein